ncbi:MAG: D-alanyl-D-alanine carboxypeptidase [Clostridia bacterium]|nr:D-alanyl-D-alanine carboxypeptidase [Clostridia bacterium]MCI8979472.1 D-alanyl-D-alanine carboxypeptidase [Clostridia bacterium]MCI9086132.1 D-alanyl-D-alanine carboxypeptidase [Clostridia bacterium]
MKKIICFLICVCSIMQSVCVFAEGETAADLGINAKAVILVEESSGNVLYEDNPDERLPIASVTKIMTMLLIMEAVDDGKITLDDMVSVSENAMSYGGSTMFLETGEQLTVNDMLKGIAVASANDGCVAMAEYLAGSESAFVDMMNDKARELGMENTHFMNTNGLDEDDHYSSARDVSIMSRELIKHKTIFNYTSIWMDTLRGGKFQLANTNKLIRFYDGANGLKTGSTSKALCCLSASAKRNDMQLIAVVLGAPTSAQRFSSAKALLDYGFANYSVNTQITAGDKIQDVKVEKGVDDEVSVVAADTFSTLIKKGGEDNITTEIIMDEVIYAPLEAGDKVGTMKISRDGQTVAEIDLITAGSVEKKGIGLIIKDFLRTIFYGGRTVAQNDSV